MASLPRHTAHFDLVAFSADGFPVLVAEVKAGPGRAVSARRALHERGSVLGAPYGLAVDSQVVQLVDLTAGLEAEPLLEIPTREILDAYAHGLAAERVSEHYLILLVDSWLRNVMQPLPSSTVPGLDRIRALGLAARLEDGRVVTEWRGLY